MKGYDLVTGEVQRSTFGPAGATSAKAQARIVGGAGGGRQMFALGEVLFWTAISGD